MKYDHEPNVYSSFRPIVKDSITQNASIGPVFNGILRINEIISTNETIENEIIPQNMVDIILVQIYI